jgi:hypothetical protein
MSTSVAEFSMMLHNSNMMLQNCNMAFQNFNMAFQTSEHDVSNSEHGVSLGAGHAPATTLWRARASANGCPRLAPRGRDIVHA